MQTSLHLRSSIRPPQAGQGITACGVIRPSVRREGEAYRQRLWQQVKDLGLESHVAFVDDYLSQPEIVDYLLASDVYITPYLDPMQITSGTLAYALGAGKAIISTPYLHAAEVLADERGLLVDLPDG